MLQNARSGRGRAPAAVAVAAAALREHGHEVSSLVVGESHGRLADELPGAGLLILAGGDGTVHKAAEHAIRHRVPIYHLPCGNENLLAREFGMSCEAGRLVRAVSGGNIIQVDVGHACEPGAGASLFVLMCSLGPDAGVIERLTSSRIKANGHSAYLGPVFRELLRPRLPMLRVRVDGRSMVNGERGLLVVANCRQYGFRVDPAHLASMTDGRLDAVFMPCRTSLGALRWLARARQGRHAAHPALRYWRGHEIVVQAQGPYQLDGDAPATGSHLYGELTLTLQPRALDILVP